MRSSAVSPSGKAMASQMRRRVASQQVGLVDALAEVVEASSGLTKSVSLKLGVDQAYERAVLAHEVLARHLGVVPVEGDAA